MEIINASYEILKKPDPTDKMGVLKFIERIGRTCYKSEDKITDESCVKFITMLKNRKHWAMLEHYIFTLAINEEIYYSMLSAETGFDMFADSVDKRNYIRLSKCAAPEAEYRYILSASATALNYLWDTQLHRGHTADNPIGAVFEFMLREYPELMMDPVPESKHGNPLTDLIHFIPNEKLWDYNNNTRSLHDWMSVKFITNRGISHELCRHRPVSFAQESTRYVNYNKKGMQVIRPPFFEDDSTQYMIWLTAMEQTEEWYNNLLELGARPEQARDVLPNSLKTEVVMTARLGEWIHFFDMRADEAAHPEMRELAIPLLQDAVIEDPRMFSDIYFKKRKDVIS